MTVAIQIDEEFYRKAEKVASAEFRTADLQIAFWAKVGKAAIDNPDLPVEFIIDTLRAAGDETEPFVFEK